MTPPTQRRARRICAATSSWPRSGPLLRRALRGGVPMIAAYAPAAAPLRPRSGRGSPRCRADLLATHAWGPVLDTTWPTRGLPAPDPCATADRDLARADDEIRGLSRSSSRCVDSDEIRTRAPRDRVPRQPSALRWIPQPGRARIVTTSLTSRRPATAGTPRRGAASRPLEVASPDGIRHAVTGWFARDRRSASRIVAASRLVAYSNGACAARPRVIDAAHAPARSSCSTPTRRPESSTIDVPRSARRRDSRNPQVADTARATAWR